MKSAVERAPYEIGDLAPYAPYSVGSVPPTVTADALSSLAERVLERPGRRT